MRKLVIFGVGKIGDVVTAYFARDGEYEIAGFTTDRAFLPQGRNDVVPFEEVEKHFSPKTHDMFVAIGYHDLNKVRAQRCADAKTKGYRLATYISPSNRYVTPEQVGENCFIMPGEPLQPEVSVGDGCFVWTNALVGHHTKVGNYNWITSGVAIGGNCRIGDHCFFGMGATVGHEVTIGANCIVGAGALVVKDAPEGSVYIQQETQRFRLNSAQFLRMNALK